MADRIFIYSTLTSPQEYTNYKNLVEKGSTEIQLPEVIGSVLINGGANVASSKLITERGVRTEISREDYAFLQQNDGFNAHVKAGFITMRTEKVDPEVAAAEMKQKDDSAPVTPNDFINQIGKEGVAVPQGVGK